MTTQMWHGTVSSAWIHWPRTRAPIKLKKRKVTHLSKNSRDGIEKESDGVQFITAGSGGGTWSNSSSSGEFKMVSSDSFLILIPIVEHWKQHTEPQATITFQEIMEIVFSKASPLKCGLRDTYIAIINSHRPSDCWLAQNRTCGMDSPWGDRWVSVTILEEFESDVIHLLTLSTPSDPISPSPPSLLSFLEASGVALLSWGRWGCPREPPVMRSRFERHEVALTKWSTRAVKLSEIVEWQMLSMIDLAPKKTGRS